MLMYALIGISLVLLGIAGLQFTYMFYIDRVYSERRRYTHSLEQKCARLSDELARAKSRIREQDQLISAARLESSAEDEAWADVIGDS